MRLPYDEPTEQPDPCCIEEPTHTDYGYPDTVKVEELLDRCTPEELRNLARGGLLAMADLGSESQLSDAHDHCVQIQDELNDNAPSWLPTTTEQSKSAARYWCDVLSIDPKSRDRWTEDEED